jgi:hypothetical protein
LADCFPFWLPCHCSEPARSDIVVSARFRERMLGRVAVHFVQDDGSVACEDGVDWEKM